MGFAMVLIVIAAGVLRVYDAVAAAVRRVAGWFQGPTG